MIFLWVPETKQRTLEELDYIFAVPTRTHMRYQITKALPYFFHRWVLRRKDAVLEPLYHFDSSNNDSDRIEAMYAADRARAEKNNGNGDGSGSDVQIENQTDRDEISEK